MLSLSCKKVRFQRIRPYEEEIRSFVRQNQQRHLGQKKLYLILSLYEECVKSARQTSESFEKFVLHYITERSFWSDMKDGEFVVKLLKYLYQQENHFAFFMFPNKDHFLSFVNFRPSNIDISRFFLNHANKQRLTICGKRMADLDVVSGSLSLKLHPCHMAVTLESPEMLLLLLQYGALLEDASSSVRSHGDPTYYDMILPICMKQIIKQIVEISHADSKFASPPDMENPIVSKIILCGKYVVRVCPQLQKRQTKFMSIKFPGFRSVHQALEWVTRHVLPDLQYRMHDPVSLKHACRLKIRKQLYNNWQLPHGLDELPLPSVMKKYLNLLRD